MQAEHLGVALGVQPRWSANRPQRPARHGDTRVGERTAHHLTPAGINPYIMIDQRHDVALRRQV